VFAALVIAFVVVPLAELYVIVQASHVFGVWPTLGLLLCVSLFGGFLVKREGFGVYLRARRRIEAGQLPGRELVDGVLILFAGALLLAPGFITDFCGLLLLLPPVRAIVRATALRVLAGRVVEL
jgi:UPF0716 protein FxsA